MSIFALIYSCGLIPVEKNNSLTSAEHVNDKIQNGESLQLIDVRTEYEYLHSHIPGALNIWRDDILKDGNKVDGMAMIKDELKELLSSLGVNHDDTIFLYDSRGNVDASRLWWMLKMYGHDKVALIDGGFIQWRLKGYEVTEGQEYYDPSRFVFLDEEKPEFLVSKSEVMATERQLVDTRSLEEFDGTMTKNGAVRAGHIPGAIRFDYVDMLDGGSFMFKSKEQILRLMAGKGISREKGIITYCHSGVRSALALFVFREIVGIEDVSNYDGSWIEWSRDESLPIEK